MNRLADELIRLRSQVAELERMTSALRRMERSVRSSEEKYRALFRCNPVPTITWQSQGEDFVLADYNMAAEEFSGGLLVNFIGKKASLLYHDRPDIQKILARCFERNTVICEEMSYRMFTRGDDRLIFFTFAFVPPDLVLSHMDDVTRRRAVEEQMLRSEAQMRTLSDRLLTAAEDERKRIASELHDSIGQYLTAIKLNAENTASLLQDGACTDAMSSLTAGIPLIRQTIDEIRRVMMSLRPTILDDLGILATLSWLCREMQVISGGLKLERDIRITEQDIPEPLKIIIFRIIQESLNNAIKYSHADHVWIGLKKSKKEIVLTVTDDGIGFDPQATLYSETNGGVGLISMRERAELSGGSLVILSALRRGTVIRASWPV